MLKAKPKGSSGWQSHEYCTFGISIGNPNCDGEKLRAMVNWLNEQSNFKGCIVDLSDTLNRYNVMVEEGVNEETARAQSVQDGQEWLARNKATLDKLKIPYKVVHWSTWLGDPVIKEYERAFYDAFKSDEQFRSAVLADVNRYHERHDRSLWEIENISRMGPSIQYLIEELAVHSRMYERGPCATIYPGVQQSSFEMVRAGKVANVPTGLQSSHFVRMNIYDDKPQVRPTAPGGKPPKSIAPANDAFHAAGSNSRRGKGGSGFGAGVTSYFEIICGGASALASRGYVPV